MTKALEPHLFADVFPELDGEAFDALVKDIEARGQQEPIWVYEGKILDGRNRYRACQLLGREPKVQDYVGDDPIGFVLSANLHRRHLNESQRAMKSIPPLYQYPPLISELHCICLLLTQSGSRGARKYASDFIG